MEIRKIKISPEVLKKDVSDITLSGQTFGYYSGLTKYLSQTIDNTFIYRRTSPIFPGGLQRTTANFTPPLGYDDFILSLNRFDTYGKDQIYFIQKLNIGQKIVLVLPDKSTLEYFLYETPQYDYETSVIKLGVIALDTQTKILPPNNSTIIVKITQENFSLLDISIPILLQQNYEDIGYYSPFDGDLSQFNEELNFTFVQNPLNNYEICIYNTSNKTKTYLSESNYYVNWGDNGNNEQVTVVIPDGFCHAYTPISDKQYTISFTGTSSFGEFIVKKNLIVPFDNVVIDNPYGEVTFLPQGGSWETTPISANYISQYDSENIPIVITPFTITGYTVSKINQLSLVGSEKFRLNVPVKLPDGTEGMITSISDDFTGYTINDQVYHDYPNGTTIFICISEGLTDNMVSTTGITKLEYLMNVIEQPIIENTVFIERGKNSGLENFRRIGEVSSTGGLVSYGYSYFDVRNFNDI